MSFELTINGRTKRFDSAAEMAEWMERTKSVKPRPYKRRKKKGKKTQKGLSDRIPKK